MKKHTLLILPVLLINSVSAQNQEEPHIIPAAFGQKIDRTGSYIMAQYISGSTIAYDIARLDATFYGGYYPGNGNCITNEGMLVGQDMETSRGVIMKNGTASIPGTLNNILQSSLDAITPDGKRACGWIQNAKGGPIQLPFYCDIDDNGTVGEPIILPYPSKDLFNDTPQYCTASYISDDGKRIAGIVQDGTGFYAYPIVYSQLEDGSWEYTCPSEPLFNPNHLEIPEYPDFDNIEVPKAPEITDFMTPEKKEEWEKAMQEYESSGGNAQRNPWSDVTYYTGDEGYDDFEKAIVEYNQEVNNIIGKVLDDYWMSMAKVGEYARFIPNLAFSHD